MWLFFGGFMVHLVFLASMFDIYFKTPIVRGISPTRNPVPGPAKRLVFIVADGLRADSFFSSNKNITPFLRKKLEEDGSWGVSHTRVPTESRPGTVALAAGIYEDPSAVFKGWKQNPVEFDSIFNQSHHTWAWGSPDIVNMFTQENVLTMSYEPEDEDFSGKDSSWKLDTWVFDHVELFFHHSLGNSALTNLLHENKIVLFLHLLGLDTAGHTIKPNALKYQENLRIVDSGVEKIERLVENFYNFDGRTAYVFTADHGMTDWGSHGAGSRDETEVPLVAWGAGLQGPRSSDPWDPVSPRHWHVSHLKRKDVHQADIVTLLSSLIGCSVPVNSVGRLPRAYLDVSHEHIAKLSFHNTLQLAAQAARKQELVQSGTLAWLYRPYWKLTPDEAKMRIALIEKFISSKSYDTAVQLCEELAELSIKALHYYHNYYQGLLLICTSFSFLGWIAWLLCELKLDSKSAKQDANITVNRTFLVAAAFVTFLIQVQGLDLQFNIYCILPLLLWWKVFQKLNIWVPFIYSRSALVKFVGGAVVLVGFTEIMVAAFFQRWVLSVGVLACALWPILSLEQAKKVPPVLLGGWLASCATLAIFPLLPVIGSETSLFMVLLSGCLWFFGALYVMTWSGRFYTSPSMWLQMIILFLVMLTVSKVAISLDLKDGLPFVCQAFSWCILFGSPLTCIFGERLLPLRLAQVLLSLLSPYLLLSVRHEAVFLFALTAHLFCWMLVEAHIVDISLSQFKTKEFPPPFLESKLKRALTTHDFRRAALFVFYIFFSFFGTGNIASLNSFEIVWVRCFVSVFSPFTMMALILFKMIVPFIIVSSIFRAINVILKAPTKFTFIAILIVCDLLGLHFLHLVTNEGSWLDIGTSISHYVIVQVTVLALVLLYGLASILTGASLNIRSASQSSTGKSESKKKSVLPTYKEQ